MERSIRELGKRSPDARARVAGRVVSATEGSCTVRDDTGVLEACCDPAPAPGSWVVLEGVWDGERMQNVSVLSLTTSTDPFPVMDGEWHRAHRIDLHATLSIRGRVMRAVRDFFDARGFIEVDTPMMVPSPGLDLYIDAFEVANSRPSLWLRTSPEFQMKRLLSAGFPKIYQIGKSFRRDEQGQLHQPEFTTVEWYRAFGGSEELMLDTEQLVSSVAKSIRGETALPARGEPVETDLPWERIAFADAFERYAGNTLAEVEGDDDRLYHLLAERVEPRLGKGRACFLTRYPARMAQLARLHPGDPETAERFEAYIDGVELCNGFAELIDPAEQQARFEAEREERRKLGKPDHPIDHRFLRALREGLPFCAGNALGLDRLIMLLLGKKHIDDVLAIPSSRL